MKVTIKTTPLIFKSIIISAIIYFIFYDFIFDIFSDYNDYQFLSIVSYILLAIILYLVLFLINKNITYEISSNSITRTYKIFNRTITKVLYSNKKVTYEIKDNPFLSFGYESRINIYELNINKKIFSFVIKKDDIGEFESIINGIQKSKKEPYHKNNKYFKDYKALISFLIIGSFLIISTILFLYLIIGLLKIVFPKIEASIYLILFIITAIVYTFTFLYFIFKYQYSNFKIEKDYLLISDGVIFKRRILIDRNSLNEYCIYSFVLNKPLNSYFLVIKLSKFNRIIIPIHKENIFYLTGIKINEFIVKIKPLYKELFLAIIPIIIISTFIIFKSIFTSLLFLIFGLSISFYLFLNSKTVIDNKKLILLNNFFISRTDFIDITKIKNVNIKKSIRNNYLFSFKIKNRKVQRIISKDEKNKFF